MARLLAFVILIPLLGACATARRRGDEAFGRGAYLEAADQYAAALADDPKDAGLRERRDDARRRALSGLLGTAQRHLSGGRLDAGLRDAEHALRRSLAWMPLTLAPAQQHQLEDVTAAAGEAVGKEVQALLAAGRALEAESALKRRKLMDLSPLVALRDRLRAEVARAGEARCQELQDAGVATGGDGPYWTELVGRYCAHFGRQAATPVLPDLIGGFAVAGALDDVPGHGAMVHAWLDGCLRRSVWFDAAGAQAPAALQGSYQVEHAQRQLTVQAPWTERVPYSVTETYRQPHQVSYSDTEWYTTYVSRTTYRSESYSCGYGKAHRTCTRSVPHTTSEPQRKSRLVTRYRTEYRTAWRTVTRHRHEPRVFSYPAIEHTTRYALAGQLTLPLVAGADPVVVPIAHAEQQRGVEHNSTFAPAGVAPTQPDLQDPSDWLQRRFDRLAFDLVGQLNAAWEAAFCSQTTFSLDEAARCLRSGARPAAAMATLKSVVGDDALALCELASRPR